MNCGLFYLLCFYPGLKINSVRMYILYCISSHVAQHRVQSFAQIGVGKSSELKQGNL